MESYLKSFYFFITILGVVSATAGDWTCGSQNSECLNGWRLLNAEKCFLLESISEYIRDYHGAFLRCNIFKAELLKTNDISGNTTACLESFLQDHWRTTIWLQSNTSHRFGTVFDVQQNTEHNALWESNHHYVCARERGSSQELSFTMNVTGHRSIQSATIQGNDVLLTCSTKTGHSNALRITRSRINETVPVNILTESTVTLNMTNISCDKMDRYVCEGPGDETVSLDVGIFGCDPRLCPGAENLTIIFASLKETKNVSFCVIAYPSISHAANLNGITIRVNERLNKRWFWVSENRSFSTYTIKVTISNISQEDYGNYTMTFSTSQPGTKCLEYNIYIRPPGPPACPRDIQATFQGVDYIELSWQPGFDGGVEQFFHIFLSADNETWTPFFGPGGMYSVNVTNLKPDTLYAFRVAASNGFLTYLDENTCDDTIFTKTGYTLDDSVDTPNILYYAVLGAAVATGFMLIVGAIILIIRRNLKGTRESDFYNIPRAIQRNDERTHAVGREEEDHYDVITENDQHAEISFINTERRSAEDGNYQSTEDNDYITPLDKDTYSH